MNFSFSSECQVGQVDSNDFTYIALTFRTIFDTEVNLYFPPGHKTVKILEDEFVRG